MGLENKRKNETTKRGQEQVLLAFPFLLLAFNSFLEFCNHIEKTKNVVKKLTVFVIDW